MTHYTLPSIESPDSFWITRSQRSRRRVKGLCSLVDNLQYSIPCQHDSVGFFRLVSIADRNHYRKAGAYMSTWQGSNDGVFSPNSNAHWEWTSRVQHRQCNRRYKLKPNPSVTYSVTSHDKHEAFSEFILQIHEHNVKESSQKDKFVSELGVSPLNKL